MNPAQHQRKPASTPSDSARSARSPAPWVPGQRRGHTLADTASDALTPIELSLDAFFRAFDPSIGTTVRDIPLLALRGARGAPRFRESSDLDLVCQRRHLKTVERALRDALNLHGVRTLSVDRAPELVKYQLYAPCGPGRHHHLCVDLHTARTCAGLPFLDATELIEGADFKDGIRRPSTVTGAFLTFLDPYLSRGEVREEYASRLEVVYEKNPAALRALAGRLVGTRRADAFCAALRAGRRGPLAGEARPFRRALLTRAFLRSPLRSSARIVARLIARRGRPNAGSRGLSVAILGAAGTGKSTLAAALHQELASSFRSRYNRTIQLRPGLLPSLGRRTGGVRRERTRGSAPSRRSPGTLATWLRGTYYWLDYTVGYALRVLPLRRHNSLVLFERWIDDWLVDPARYGLRADSRFVSWLVRCTPRPDVVLVTTAPHRVVRSRRPDSDAREVLRMLTAYEDHAVSRGDVFVVDTARSEDDMVDAAVLAMLTGSGSAAPRLEDIERDRPRGEAA